MEDKIKKVVLSETSDGKCVLLVQECPNKYKDININKTILEGDMSIIADYKTRKKFLANKDINKTKDMKKINPVNSDLLPEQMENVRTLVSLLNEWASKNINLSIAAEQSTVDKKLEVLTIYFIEYVLTANLSNDYIDSNIINKMVDDIVNYKYKTNVGYKAYFEHKYDIGFIREYVKKTDIPTEIIGVLEDIKSMNKGGIK